MLNTIQKIGVLIASSVFMILFILHNPTGGYDKTELDYSCAISMQKHLILEASKLAGVGVLNRQEIEWRDKYVEDNRWKIDMECDIAHLPFLDWISNKSMFTQITSIKDFLPLYLP